ncbi:MAG: DEAD/DEAH box helicase [Bacteroidetes bacterium]|nr:DEAD/DEAH box helicase [Bacteroidota bacterium]
MITFEELGVAPNYIKAIQELGFENPMPVQEKVIPLLLAEVKDIIVLAQTGTGKTAAYGLPIIQQTDLEQRHPQTLILCPTRELCIQIAGDLNDFAKYEPGLKTLPVYGGSSMEVQINTLKRGVHIVVATPGRLCDLIRRKAIKLNMITRVVLDEADEMLNMGFQESINDILAQVPDGRTTLLFSATMPNEVAVIARKYMHDATEVTIGDRNTGADNIKHQYYFVHARDKYLALKRIVDYYPAIYGIVFCRTRIETQEVADKLIHDGYNAESLHGDLSQVQRDTVMNKFRIRHIKLLVATDVAARGLDVDDLSHIINYNLPDDLDAYTHRSGRTARAGKTGTSIVLLNMREKHFIKQIERKINKTFVAMKVPSGRQICEKQLFNLLDKMEKVDIEHQDIDSYLPQILRKLEYLDKEEIIKRFVALEFNRFLEYYRNAPELNIPEDKEPRDGGDRRGKQRDTGNYLERRGKSRDSGGYSERRSKPGDSGGYAERRGKRDEGRDNAERRSYRKESAPDSRDSRESRGGSRPVKQGFRKGDPSGDTRQQDTEYTLLSISEGKADGMNPGNLIELINRNTPGKMIPIGRIEMKKNATIFEVPVKNAVFLVRAMDNVSFHDQPADFGPSGSSQDKPKSKKKSSGDFPKAKEKRKRTDNGKREFRFSK